MPVRFMVTQPNPQKWLRVGDESDHDYTEDECRAWGQTLFEANESLIKYLKIAHETGEGGLRHLQMFIYLHKDSRKGAIVKLFPKADVRPCKARTAVAAGYIGNPDFRHTDGKEKGGSVQYVIELGTLDCTGEITTKAAETSTEERLLGLKELIDSGESYKALWSSDFYCMCRYHSPLLFYYKMNRAMVDENGLELEYKHPILSSKNEKRLKQKNEQLIHENADLNDKLTLLEEHITWKN